MAQINVMVVDDHPAFREGLARILQEEGDLNVVATSGSGKKAIGLALDLKPDIMVMEVALPDMDGIEVIRQIKTRVPEIAILIVSAFNYRQYILNSLKEGVSGYLLKEAPLIEIIKAIRMIFAGNAVFNLKAANFSQLADEQAENSISSMKLLPRELEVLSLVAKGMGDKSIANQMNITVRTVQAHLIHIFRKLGITSRTEAVLCGLRQGWLYLENLVANHESEK